MRFSICYPLPFDQWLTFESPLRRFADSFRWFPPLVDYELHIMCCWGEPTDDIRRLFYGIKTVFHSYNDNGCDIGSAQYLARHLPNKWMLCLTSRCYFHRRGWLARYREAIEKHGDAFYSASASWEGGRPHLCTRAYALTTDAFREYPHTIDEREKGQLFESGDWCISDWFKAREKKLIQVTWGGEQDQDDWRKPDNIFRKGNQEQMLVFDRHSDLYEEADETERVRLTAMADPPVAKMSKDEVIQEILANG